MADDTTSPAEDSSPVEAPAIETMFDVPVTRTLGQTVLHCTAQEYPALVKKLHDDGYLMCVDLTVVDYLTVETDRGLPPGVEPERFELVANFLNHSQRARVRLRVQVSGEEPTVESITDLYPGADAMEREAFDMFGVSFTGHPDLTRILMPEDWVGHPLRKDYNSGRIPVQFKNPVNTPVDPR
jgi:NADH-quinone oxidoreductase subunit C